MNSTGTILVICHGNINRSPACAAVLRDEGIRKVVSAGFVNPGKRAAKKMRDAMGAEGYNPDMEEHRSQAVTRKMIEEALWIVYMDDGNLGRLNQMITVKESLKLIRLSDYATTGNWKRIPDPAFMAKASAKFHDTVALIIDCSLNLATKLKN